MLMQILIKIIFLSYYTVNSYPYWPTCLSSNINNETLILTTLNGQVKGSCYNVTVNYASKPKETKPILSFLKIPYAQPPINELRFKNPKPVNSWGSNILDGTQLPTRCIQSIGLKFDSKNISEDCLNLNIFVPYQVYLNAVVLKNDSYRAPIYVSIHGGGFIAGSGLDDNTEPSTFVAMSNVIVVNINYRIGIFGFLYLNDTQGVSGNQGIYDQTMALKWIYENANTFGGDSSRITIGGDSAGGYSTSFHLIHKPSWPYFKNVIVQSGNMLDLNSRLITAEEATKRSFKIIQDLNCSNDKLLECLQKIPADLINSMYGRFYLRYPLIVLDGINITKQPSELVSNGDFKPGTNLLIGSNTKEHAYFIALNENIIKAEETMKNNMSVYYAYLKDWYKQYPFQINNPKLNSIDDFINEIIRMYPLSNNSNYFENFINIATDSSFKYPSIELAYSYSKFNKNVYVYSYGYHLSTSLLPSKWEAVHADDLPMTWADPLSTKTLPLISENPFSSALTNYSAEERLICESMVKYWINFVKSDNPGEEWPKFNNGDKLAKIAIMFLNGNNSKLLNYSINDQLYQFWTNSKSLKIESNFILIILLVIFQLF